MKTIETNECLSKRRNDSREGLEVKHGAGELVEDAGTMKTQKRNEQGPRSELDNRKYQI